MSAMSNYLENKLIDALLRGSSYVPPSAVFLALYTSAPDDAGPGAEVVGGGYARVEIPCDLTHWSGTDGQSSTAISTGETASSYLLQAATFPRATALWGVITHAALLDAPSGGNLLFHGAFGDPFVINQGARVSFQPGSVAFAISAGSSSLFAPADALLIGSGALVINDLYLSI